MPKADFPIESIAEEEEDANAMQKAQSQQAPPRAIAENASPLNDANHEESQDEMLHGAHDEEQDDTKKYGNH